VMRPLTLVAGSPRVRIARGALLIAAAVVLWILPQSMGDASDVDMLSQVAAYVVALVGLTLVTGLTGQISLGHGAFMGLGAYTTVILVADHGWSYLATLPIAIVLCFVAGALVGIPALRISGLYLATVTLAIAAVFPTLVMQFDGLTDGANGKFAVDEMEGPSWFPVDLDTRVGPSIFHYYVIVAIAIVVFLLARNIVRSRVGRGLVAIRDSPYSAAAAGVPVARYKILAFATSAAFAGLAGSLLMIQLPQATTGRFDVNLSIFLLIGLIAGGRATIWGAIPGAIIFVILRNYLPDWIDGLNLLSGPNSGQVVGVLSGVLLIGFAFALPGGVIDGLGRIARRVVRVRRPPPRDWTEYRMAPGEPPPSVPAPAQQPVPELHA
jgi:branched-chain amino acid transport system permease protein